MNYKKLYISFIFCLFLVSYVFCNYSIANDSVEVFSPSVLLIEGSTNKVLFDKSSREKRYPASLTKIMTAILTLENCALDDVAVVSYNAVTSIPEGYSTADLQLDESLTIDELLHLLLIPSSNDAAVVLAEHIAGSVESFATMMNTRSVELGCVCTNFVNPNGIHNSNHYSCAYDLSLMANFAMNNKIFRNIVSTTSYTLPATNKYDKNDRVFSQTNELLKKSSSNYYSKASGIKTGFTTPAQNCLVASAEKDGLELLVVILGAGQTDNGLNQRYLDAKTLFNYGFNNFVFKKVKSSNDLVKTIEVAGATSDSKILNLAIENDISILVSKNFDDNILPEFSLNKDISAPISAGTVLGSISYSVEGISYSSNLIASSNVKKSYLFYVVSLVMFIGLVLFLFYRWKVYRKNSNNKKVKMYHS